MGKKKTQEEYVKELAIKNPIVKLTGEYIDFHTPTMHHCETHNVFWNISPGNALRGSGCKKCRGEKIGNRFRKPIDQYVRELELNNPTIKLVGEYIDANTPTEHYCEVHKIVSKITPSNALHGAGCVECHHERIGDRLRKPEDTYIAELSVKNPTVKLAEKYINATTPVSHFCEIHHVFGIFHHMLHCKGKGANHVKMSELVTH